GIVKAYTTRVGQGPFPTELFDSTGEKLQDKGSEFGATTGRRRRCGWLDAVMLKNAARLNSLTGIAITKLDVLDELEEIKICTGYEYKGGIVKDFPASIELLNNCTPVYETMPGWNQDTSGTRDYNDLPDRTRDYLKRIEELTEVKIKMISVGPARESTIIIDNLFH
ncbi:MAG: adenylosuccinate synthetase, partial [Desulfobacteraceae bacterium]